MSIVPRFAVAAALGVFLVTAPGVSPAVAGEDAVHWGLGRTRNLVSTARGLPDRFDPATGQNVRWVADLGTEAHASPMVGFGRVIIGTNNNRPRDRRHEGDRGVVMCFDASDGRFLWQFLTPKYSNDPLQDYPNSGMSSTATLERDRVYMMGNRGEAFCLDALGQANGNDGAYTNEASLMVPRGADPLPLLPSEGDLLWVFDVHGETGSYAHDAAHSSFLLDGPWVYLNTGNGVDNTHRKIRSPEAPSLIVLDRRTGGWVARDDEHLGPTIFHCTWSSPALAEVGGRKHIVFCGGNGVVYGFEALPPGPETPRHHASPQTVRTLRKLWWVDFDPEGPKQNVHRYHLNKGEGPSNMFGMPVVVGDRVFVAGGGDLWWGKNAAWLKCLQISGDGDLTRSGFRWSYNLNRHTFATPSVHNGLVYATDTPGTLHCVDAATGAPVWTHDTEGEVWASTLVADDKVYLGTRRGDLWILAAGREKRVLSRVKLDSPISGTVAATEGALFIGTMQKLYCVGK
jgi:outer membrane protein assembly factor BamB